MTHRVCIIGLGNEFRGDDAAGLLVARALRERLSGGADVLELEEGGPGVLELMKGATAAIVVDGVQSGRPVGTIQRLDVSRHGVPAAVGSPSTHGFTVAESLELGRTLGTLPPVVVLYGIEVGALAPGLGLSPGVAQAIPVATARILEEVGHLCHA